VRIETSKNAANVPPEQQLLTTTADTWNSIYNPFASYRGLDQSEMSNTVLLPLVDREVGPSNAYSTHFEIENKDPSKVAIVRVQFTGYDLDNGGAPVYKEGVFGMAGARLCFQDHDDFAKCLSSFDKMPHHLVGPAWIHPTQQLGVITHPSSLLDLNF